MTCGEQLQHFQQQAAVLSLPRRKLQAAGDNHVTKLMSKHIHTGRPWVSASTHRTSVAIRQHTQDVLGCPCVFVSTHRTSVAVHQYTFQHAGPWTQHAGPWTQHAGPWTQHAGPSRGLFGTSVGVRQHTQDVRSCPCVSLCVRQHTQDVRGYPSAVCSVHIGRLWVSVSTHRTSVCVRQHTQDIRGCSCVSVSTHRTSMAVRVCLCVAVGVRQHIQDFCGCLCVSVSKHMTSLAVHQYTYQHVGPWTQHADPSRGRTSVAIRVCPCVSVSVCVCPSALTGRPWLSISTHISTLVLGLSTLTLLVDCSGDFGPRGLSVHYTQDAVGVRQHTQDVRGCPCVSVCVRQQTQDVRGCPSVHISARWSLDSAR
ncbi:hypothetical protein YC2023_065982 [Brassica napus]